MNTPFSSSPPLQLRADAEAELAGAPAPDGPPCSPQQMLHELQVHQIELEMQNENLRQAQAALEESRDHYARRYDELYEFAPVGYLSVDVNGLIVESNLTAAGMLGVERKQLLQQRFDRFVSLEDWELWQQFFISTKNTAEKQILDVELRRRDGALFLAHLDCRLLEANGDTPKLRVAITDISERRQMELALQEREALYRALFDNNMDAVLVTTPEGGIVAANPEAQHLFGRSEEELCRIGRQCIVNASDPSFQSAIAEREKRGRFRGEQTLIDKDGQPFPGELSSSLFTSKDGRRLAHTIVRDLREQKRAEAAQRESEIRYRTLADSGRSLIWTATPDKQCDYFNQVWLDFTGRSLAQELGSGWVDGVHPEDLARCMEVYGAAFERREKFSMDYRLRRHDGEYRWILDEGSPRYNAAGEFIGYIGHCLDISERKAAEEQLRKLYLAMEQSPESVEITNLAANIEYVNEAFLQTTGYSREEVIGQNPRILKSGKTPPETYVELWETLSRGLPWQGEFINKRKDGSEYPEYVHIAPIRQPDGRVSHYVAVKEDVAEKKRVAGELEGYRHHLEDLVVMRTAELAAARDAANAANQAKSVFLANMSHEIRTPLNGILGMAHIMRRGGVNAKQADQLDKIAVSGQHLLTLINDILDLAKIEANKLILEQRDFSLAEVLRNISDVMGESIQAKGLSLHVDIAGMPQALHGDPGRLTQALLNYLSNALKFTERGRITIRARRLEETSDAYLLRFEVIDTGIGLSSTDQARLFQAFQQADGSTTRKYGGTGLGLTITRRIAELMGGEVGVNSALGQGSTFWFTVRVGKGQALPKPPEPMALAEDILRREHAGRHILLVEDDPVNQEVASLLLLDVGLVPDLAGNGFDAVCMASTGDYALILMDVQMPEMDGLAATQAIRALPGHADLPILAMTANAFNEDRQACLAAGMNDFIAKPMEPEQLFSSLLKWLEKR